MKTTILTLASLALALPAAHAQDPLSGTNRIWPQFRGEFARGISEGGQRTAIEWNLQDDEGVAWKTPIPGLAHSSPVIWGDLLFLTTAVDANTEAELSSLFGSPGYGAGESVLDEGEQEFRLYCLNKNSGEILWQRTAHSGVPKIKRHPKATHANATPACDAERVVVSFGSEGLFCYDHAGELLWKTDLGLLNVGAPGYPDESGFQWGYASSPVLGDGLVITQCDHEGDSYLAAFDADDGSEVWRIEREEDSTWCTPTIYHQPDGAGSQVIVNGYQHIGAYDLETGEEIWRLSGGGDVPVPTPVVQNELIYLTSAHGREAPVRAIRTDAQGELIADAEKEDALVWNHPRRGVYMQTPLAYDGLLYCCSDSGVLACYDALTGENLYRNRLGGGSTGFSGSPVVSGGLIYLSGESGEIFVVRAGRKFEELAVNDLEETCLATPAISEGRLYFRSRHHLIAIEARPGER